MPRLLIFALFCLAAACAGPARKQDFSRGDDAGFPSAAASQHGGTFDKAPPYLDPSVSDRCRDSERPCAFTYDFEPSGAAFDVFAPAEHRPRLLVLNEDGLIFHWSLSKEAAWDHDKATFARSLDSVLRKGESAASAVCDGIPVFLAASNFMPGWTGTHPKRERVVALVGGLESEPRILHHLSTEIRDVARREGVAWAKVEGLALSSDCSTLHVGFRSFHNAELSSEDFTTTVHSFQIDLGLNAQATIGAQKAVGNSLPPGHGEPNAVENQSAEADHGATREQAGHKNQGALNKSTKWEDPSSSHGVGPGNAENMEVTDAALPREKVKHLGSQILPLEPSCSGEAEGISGMDILPDGSLLVLSSYERQFSGRSVPADIPEGELGGSLWYVPSALVKHSAEQQKASEEREGEFRYHSGAGDSSGSENQGESGRPKEAESASIKDSRIHRLACFPGHKPEAVVALEDGKSVRVLMEDDDYGGRPVLSFAVALDLEELLEVARSRPSSSQGHDEGEGSSSDTGEKRRGDTIFPAGGSGPAGLKPRE